MKTRALLFMCILYGILCTAAQAKIIYVDDDANGTNDGSSWQNAYIYFQDALADADSAEKPVEIRVAQGTYKPNQGQILNAPPVDHPEWAKFYLINNVTLKGGYAGVNETDPNQRNIEKYKTILSGDLAGNDINVNNPIELIDEPTRSDNCLTVIKGSSTDQTAVLDGFIITGGNNKTLIIDVLQGGGGMYNISGSPTINNCTFKDNASTGLGGAIFNRSHSNPTITNCLFINNYSRGRGGGGAVANASSSPTIVNCQFKSNYTSTKGGGIYNTAEWLPSGIDNGSNPTIINCIFSGNYASNEGGGIFSYDDYCSMIRNCIFYANFARNGKALSIHWENEVNNIIISNCIFWDGDNEMSESIPSTLSVTYSDIQGGWEGQGNIDIDPLFANPGYWADVNDPNIVVEPNNVNAIWIDGDYHLKSQAGRYEPNTQTWIQDDVTSPCIDAGELNSPIGLEPFPNGGRINMGAYGGTEEASKSYFGKPVCRTIVAGDINGDCKVDILDLEIMMSHWLEEH
jgi:hypothetical protein